MPIFNVPRTGRKQDGYLEGLLKVIFEHEQSVYKEGFGVCDLSPDIVAATFYSVRNAFGKINSLKTHRIELHIEREFGDDITLEIARYVGNYFLFQGFITFVGIIKLENYYLIEVLINAVSHLNGLAFQDNNWQYVQVYNALKTVFPADWRVSVMDSAFYDSKNLAKSYVCGKLG